MLRTKHLAKIIGLILSVIILLLYQAALAAPLENPLKGTDSIITIGQKLVAGFVIVTGALAFFWTVVGGYQILTARGNEETYARGKTKIGWAIIGYLFVTASYVLLSGMIKIITGSFYPDLSLTPALINPLGSTGLEDPLGLSLPVPDGVMSAFIFYGNRLLGFMTPILGSLTLLMVVYGGVVWAMSGGNEERIATAKKTLTYAAIGLAVILGAYTLLNTIYQPAYRLLKGEQPTVRRETVAPDLPNNTPIVCFRKKIGSDYGATCSLETRSSCLKATADKQPGEAYTKLTDCNAIGACVQNLPGTAIKNRVAATNCQTGDQKSMQEFPALNNSLSNGTCPFPNTTAVKIGNAYRCFANVQFIAGKDLPDNDKAPCLRERATDTHFFGAVTRTDYGRFSCFDDVPTSECKKPIDDYRAGTSYPSTVRCGQIGFCQQDHYDYKTYGACTRPIIEGACAPSVFQPQGQPIPVFGCRSLTEISGNCYAPTTFCPIKNFPDTTWLCPNYRPRCQD